MDVSKILGELRQEREQLEEAIMSLERLARGRGKRRGRPPSWMVEAKKRGRPVGSKNRSQRPPLPSRSPCQGIGGRSVQRTGGRATLQNESPFSLLR